MLTILHTANMLSTRVLTKLLAKYSTNKLRQQNSTTSDLFRDSVDFVGDFAEWDSNFSVLLSRFHHYHLHVCRRHSNTNKLLLPQLQQLRCAKFRTFFALQNFRRATPPPKKNMYPNFQNCLTVRHMEKFREVTRPVPKDIRAHMLNYGPIFEFSFIKDCWGPRPRRHVR